MREELAQDYLTDVFPDTTKALEGARSILIYRFAIDADLLSGKPSVR